MHINQLSLDSRATMISRARQCTRSYHKIVESAPDFAHSATADTPDKVLVVAGAKPRNDAFLYGGWTQEESTMDVQQGPDNSIK